MSAPDRELKAEIANYLEAFGFEVFILEGEAEHKTPDLLAMKRGQRNLIEVKTKTDNPGELLERKRKLAQGEPVIYGTAWAPRNTIAGIARDGIEQLKSRPRENYDFSLLWLHAEGTDPESQIEQFGFTLYGKTKVFSPLNLDFLRDCYYFHESVFYRWRDDLDGAVISMPQGSWRRLMRTLTL